MLTISTFLLQHRLSPYPTRLSTLLSPYLITPSVHLPYSSIASCPSTSLPSSSSLTFFSSCSSSTFTPSLFFTPSRPFGTHVIRAGDTLIVIPRDFITTSFSRSSGAGGQNVNKVNTKAEIRFHLDSARWLDNDVKERFRTLYGPYINNEGEVYVTSQEHRTQEANLEECFTKLSKFLRRSALIPKVRAMRTGLSELTKTERREDKRHRSVVKERRKGSGITFDD